MKFRNIFKDKKPIKSYSITIRGDDLYSCVLVGSCKYDIIVKLDDDTELSYDVLNNLRCVYMNGYSIDLSQYSSSMCRPNSTYTAIVHKDGVTKKSIIDFNPTRANYVKFSEIMEKCALFLKPLVQSDINRHKIANSIENVEEMKIEDIVKYLKG